MMLFDLTHKSIRDEIGLIVGLTNKSTRNLFST